MHICLVVVALGAFALPGCAGPSAGRARAPAGPERAPVIDERQARVFEEMMRAVNAGDAAGYADLYAEDAVITIHGSAVLRGRAAIEQHEVELLRAFPGARLAFYALWQDGPTAVVHYAVDCPTATAAPSPARSGHEGLLWYRFASSGLIAEERRYLDSLTPMAQLGALGAVPARPPPELPTACATRAARGSRLEEENAASVLALFAALDAEDGPAFLALLAEDAVLDELLLPEPHAGRAGAQAWFQAWTDALTGARSEITSLLAAGDFVLAEMVLRATLTGPLGPLSAAGRPFAVHRAVIVELAEGRMRRLSSFINGKELAQAVGQWPPAAR